MVTVPERFSVAETFRTGPVRSTGSPGPLFEGFVRNAVQQGRIPAESFYRLAAGESVPDRPAGHALLVDPDRRGTVGQ
ncbi:hypothetical protein [Halorientalis pallida]|uniref:Uncharacterized protein n=1 Tax=Halorientalis pallida TaxID=2479928 RepID=A0A498KYW3_9EURY|nr:hypothetical protein [Halorientalis pallida]RXK51240.1 hypothetical protein EAF64_00935 [Halorientalis pallida]